MLGFNATGTVDKSAVWGWNGEGNGWEVLPLR